MASSTTEIPVSPASPKTKSNETLEAEAIGMETAVRVHGSQITAVVLESTEHVEPFEEDTTTMIVFPRGGVVKLRARVRTGHALVLTNLQSKQTALCRIVQVNSAGTASSYVKLEFIQPAPGFWNIHFPSDPQSAAAVKQPAPAAESIAPPISAKPAIPAAAIVPATPRIDVAPITVSAASPAVRETSIPVPVEKKPVVAAPPTIEYAAPKIGQQEELVPLANEQPAIEMKIGIPTKPLVAPAKPPVPAASSRSNANSAPTMRGSSEPPAFDTLSTEEEVFSREPEVTRPSPVNIQTSFDPSSISQPAAAKPRSHAFAITSIVIVVLGLAAGAGYYLRNHPLPFGLLQRSRANSVAAQTSATPAASQPTAPPSSAVPTPPLSDSPAAKTASFAETGHASTPPQTAITVTPVHSGEKVINSDEDQASSNTSANIYAGDLSAHAAITPHAAATISAQPPEIGGTNAVGTAAEGLNSLVPGSTGSNLPTPASPPPVASKPLPVQGGRATPPKLMHSVNPIYPQAAITSQIEGDVQIEAQIDAKGKVTSAKVLKGPTVLQTAAIDAVRQWRYSPATLDGKPVATEYVVMVNFRLHR
ncbi:MAG TPA: TonB family protein [Candidatus Acidoferrales bacterium]|nr:TonB family protein [Candidatus Acidoferrales bacterium]